MSTYTSAFTGPEIDSRLGSAGTALQPSSLSDLTQTWNDAGTTFTAIKMNVTDTASDAASLLMDLQVGGTSKFSVTKNGQIQTATLDVGSDINNFIQNSGEIWARINRSFNSNNGSMLLARGFKAQANSYIGFASGTSLSAAADTVLVRDAADTLAQRNGVNPQTFNLYNTYTDSSNYERGFMKWNSNVLEIGTEALGTGTGRKLEFFTGTSGSSGRTYIQLGSNSGPQSTITYHSGDFTSASPSGVAHSFRTHTNIKKFEITHGGTAVFYGSVAFSGQTSSFPAIKRSTTTLQARLADDTDFTNIQGKLTTETAYTAGAPTATGYIVLYDSTGTAYKVPAEAV